MGNAGAQVPAPLPSPFFGPCQTLTAKPRVAGGLILPTVCQLGRGQGLMGYCTAQQHGPVWGHLLVPSRPSIVPSRVSALRARDPQRVRFALEDRKLA